MNRTLVENLSLIAAGLLAVLEDAGVEDISEDPEIRRMAERWCLNMQGSSLLEAVSYLFVGVISIRETLKDALRESGAGNGLSYLDDLGIPSNSTRYPVPPFRIN